MKLFPEDIAALRGMMAPLAPAMPEHVASLRTNPAVKSLGVRARWDWLNAAGGVPRVIYGYANDEHIDTALRAIAKELCPQLTEIHA